MKKREDDGEQKIEGQNEKEATKNCEGENSTLIARGL